MRQPGSTWSAEARVLFRPAATFGELMRHECGRAPLVRKPLLLAFLLGCSVSVLASGRFSVRLITDGALSFLFVPLIEMAALALVTGTGTRRGISFKRTVDLFFTGNAPWLLWLVGFAVLGCLVTPVKMGPWILAFFAGSLIPVSWSVYIDYHFYREVMNRPPASAVRDILIHRAISWVVAGAYFFGIAIWSELLPEFAAWIKP